MISTDIWVWLSALLMLCILSLLYGENPFFTFAEHTYTAIVVAHAVVSGINVMSSRFTPLFTLEQPGLIIPFILGIMGIFVVWRKYAWVASFPIAIMLGVGTGLSIRGLVNTQILGNVRQLMTEFTMLLVGSPADKLGYIIRITFTFSGMIYLLFTVVLKPPLSKPLEYVRTFGKYVFITWIAVNIGTNIMGTSVYATNAVNRLIRDWLGLA